MISVYGLICIVFVMNQVSSHSRCLITTTPTTIDVINVDDFASPVLVHSFDAPVDSANALAFDAGNERLYVGGNYGPIHSLKMMDICLAISTNSPFVPSTFMGNSAVNIYGLAYDSEEKRLYSASSDLGFARTNIYISIGVGPVNPSTPMTLTGEIFNGGSLLESFDGSEGLYYLSNGSPHTWMKISNYRHPSDSGSNAIQFDTSFPAANFYNTGLTWLNENEVLVYNWESNNLYTLNIDSEIPTQARVINLQGITWDIRGIHLFRDHSCTSLCSNNCPIDCGLDIADTLLAATRALDDASAAQTTADIAMQEIEKLKGILSQNIDTDSSEEFNSFNAIGRALRDEKYVDNNEKHITIDVSESMMVAIFGMIVFINILMCAYCNKKP